MKTLEIDGNEISIHIWDLVGQDRAKMPINKLFCKKAAGALVVSDIQDHESIMNTVNWKQKVIESYNDH